MTAPLARRGSGTLRAATRNASLPNFPETPLPPPPLLLKALRRLRRFASPFVISFSPSFHASRNRPTIKLPSPDSAAPSAEKNALPTFSQSIFRSTCASLSPISSQSMLSIVSSIEFRKPTIRSVAAFASASTSVLEIKPANSSIAILNFAHKSAPTCFQSICLIMLLSIVAMLSPSFFQSNV